MSLIESEDDPTGVPAPDSHISTEDSRQYWETQDADVNGMLGGFPAVSKVDLRGSRAFLVKLGIGKTAGLRKVERTLEGGAGIGRITRGLLLDVSKSVDVVEPIAKFTDELQDEGIGEIFNMGLESWLPADNVTYDLMWHQWCVGHLTDQQLVEYLVRCRAVLRRDEDGKTTGVIVIKENLSTSQQDLFDETDSSVTRLDEKFREIFELAGLRIVRTELQHGFPKMLYPVRMYALRPKG